MDKGEYEPMKNNEITFKELLIPVLRKWKVVIVLILVVTSAFGGYIYRSSRNAIDKQLEIYQEKIEIYNRSREAKEEEIVFNRVKAASQEEYNRSSLLMQIDSKNVLVGTLVFSVEIAPDIFYLDLANQTTLGVIDLKETLSEKIINQYLMFANASGLSAFMDLPLPENVKEIYLREVLNVEASNGIVTITAFGTDLMGADVMARSVYEYLLQKQPLISSTVKEHTLTVLEESTKIVIDATLAQRQEDNKNQVVLSLNRISKIYEELQKMQSEKPVIPSLKSDLETAIIMGVIFGIFLGVIAVVLPVLVKLPVQLPEQIQNQFGIRLLGGIKRVRKDPLIRAADRLAGNYLMANETEAYSIIAANLREVLGNNRRILVTGTLREEQIRDFATRLAKEIDVNEVELVISPSVNTSAEAIHSLSEADAVLLVERLHKSHMKQVFQIKERILLSGKPILGHVLV